MRRKRTARGKDAKNASDDVFRLSYTEYWGHTRARDETPSVTLYKCDTKCLAGRRSSKTTMSVGSPMPQTNSYRRISGIAASLWLGAVIGAFGFDSVCAEERNSKGQTLDGQPSAPRVEPALTLPRQCVCTMEYDPVCGRTGQGVDTTFSNPCRARCAGATVIRRGAC